MEDNGARRCLFSLLCYRHQIQAIVWLLFLSEVIGEDREGGFRHLTAQVYRLEGRLIVALGPKSLNVATGHHHSKLVRLRKDPLGCDGDLPSQVLDELMLIH